MIKVINGYILYMIPKSVFLEGPTHGHSCTNELQDPQTLLMMIY
jgi:hypothetical protein